MNRNLLLIPLIFIVSIAGAGGEEEGHMHGPDGRHIVTAQDAKTTGSFILTHHDMRVEDASGKSILGVVVKSTITPKDKPNDPIHTEVNVYEPENQVYGSHMTYTEPGEYLLKQDVTMPSGTKMTVDFPVYVPAVEATMATENQGGGTPNYLPIIGGLFAGLIALLAAFQMGKRTASQGVAGLIVFVLLASLVPAQALAQEDEEGHMHGPDGRHIVTEADAAKATGPQLKAYPGPNEAESATKVVDGVKFVLTIENEEMSPDPDLISLSEEQMNLIGLKTANAEVTGAATSLQTTGRVSANPNGLVKVNARSGGRVIRLGALPGTTVQRGQMLAVIESADLAEAQSALRRATAELAQSRAGIRVAEAALSAARTEVQIATQKLARETQMAQAGEFAAPALEAAKSAVSAASSKRDAAMAEVTGLEKLVARLRDGVQSGVVARRELERAESDLAAAVAARADAATQLRLAQESLTREEGIARQGLRNAREVDLARAQLETAKSNQKSAESRLIQARSDVNRVQSSIRVSRDQIALLGGSPGSGNTITVTAPISAEVEDREVSVGQTVAAGELLYDLLNADIVWVLADIYESDVPKVRVGQTIKVVADAYPGQVYQGTVAFIHNEVDPQTRTTQARIVLSNPGERLKQNMFVRIMLGVGANNAVTVPSAAIQDDRGLAVVFVEEKAGVFRRKLVRSKGNFGDRTIVEGVEAGQKVVTSGSYQMLAFGGAA